MNSENSSIENIYPKSKTKITSVLIWLAKNYVNKYIKTYFYKYKKDLPIILVAGNSGKSSVTLLIADYYKHLGYQVFTGATPSHCLNSLTGLSMVLGRFETDFEGNRAILSKIWFFFRALFGLFGQINLAKKSILVYEIGFNEQYEANYFIKIFKNKAKLVVLTNLGWEHSAGFEDKFDIQSYNNLKNHIPKHWQNILESDYPDKLKNIALEQIKLLATAKQVLYPENLNTYSNVLIDSDNNQYSLEVTRDSDLSLSAAGYNYGKGYLLPQTMAKNILLLEKVHKLVSDQDFSSLKLQEFLSLSNFPNGRFSILKGLNNSTIIDSSYNSDPDSLHGFLDLLNEIILGLKNSTLDFDIWKLGEYFLPKNILILGEMRELGDTAKLEHSQIIEKINNLSGKHPNQITDVLLLGTEWLKLYQESPEIGKFNQNYQIINYNSVQYKVFERGQDIYDYLQQFQIDNKICFWIKGSQNTIFLEGLVYKLLANKQDKIKLCRQGKSWDQKRKLFYN